MSFSQIIIYPFSLLLLWLYQVTANYGIAIILFAIVLKIILLPFQAKSKYSMMRTSRLTPILKELEKKHEGNKQKYQEEVARLYKEEKINPMSGCLWTLVPMIFLIMLYSVIRQPFTSMMHLAQDQVKAIEDVIVKLGGTIPQGSYKELQMADFVHKNFSEFQGISNKLVDLDFSFLGLPLGNNPDWKFFTSVDWNSTASWLPALGLFLIPIISGLLSYFSMKISNATNPSVTDQQQSQMKMMLLTMPLFSVYIGFVMPAALGVYWIINSVLAIIQDTILNKVYGKRLDKEDAERRERMRQREAELEKKRQETEKLREAGATERNKNTSKKKLQSAQKVQNEERVAAERAKEKEQRRAELGITDNTPASQVGNRRYARGRAYVEDRFSNPEGAEEATKAASALSDIDEAVDAEFAERTDANIANSEADENNDNGAEA